MSEGSHSGLVRAPAKRLPGLKLGRGFESHSLRQREKASGRRKYDCVPAIVGMGKTASASMPQPTVRQSTGFSW